MDKVNYTLKKKPTKNPDDLNKSEKFRKYTKKCHIQINSGSYRWLKSIELNGITQQSKTKHRTIEGKNKEIKQKLRKAKNDWMVKQCEEI